jgi:hypothetical protein
VTAIARHGPLEPLAADLWQIEADLPRLPIGRRMVIARLDAGELLVHNAIACDDATSVRIAELGVVRWLVVPSGYHRMDLPAWSSRYPACTVVTMPAASRRVARRVRVDGGPERLPSDPRVTYVPLDGVPTEGVLIHRDRDGATTLVFNDVVQNHPKPLPGVIGALLGLAGSTGGPKVTRIARVAMVDDRRAFAAHLRRLATPDVARIVPGHGAIVRDRAPDVLREMADALA